MKIQEYLDNRGKFNVDSTYRHFGEDWSMEDKQCLIDTILRGEPMPIFFLNDVNGFYYVVDGQQRLNCITQFYENNITLHAKFSGTSNHGKTFNGCDCICDVCRRNFMEYELHFQNGLDNISIHVENIRTQLCLRNQTSYPSATNQQIASNESIDVCRDIKPPCMPYGILYKHKLSRTLNYSHYINENGQEYSPCDICMHVFHIH